MSRNVSITCTRQINTIGCSSRTYWSVNRDNVRQNVLSRLPGEFKLWFSLSHVISICMDIMQCLSSRRTPSEAVGCSTHSNSCLSFSSGYSTIEITCWVKIRTCSWELSKNQAMYIGPLLQCSLLIHSTPPYPMQYKLSYIYIATACCNWWFRSR